MTEYEDAYTLSGQFIDIMISGWWEHFGETVAEAVRQMPTDQGSLLDAGAGGGWGTQLLARTSPRARILALEPSPILRAVLLSRVAADPDLRSRVTVDADDLLAARLPERLGGVLMANLIGHLSPHERDRLWCDLGPRLAPGAAVLLNLPEPVEPTRVERARMSEVRIGERFYQGWSGAEPTGPETIEWHMTYEVRDGDRLVSRDEVHYDWWTVTEASLRAETEPYGLRVAAHGPAGAGLYTVVREARA